MIELFLAFIIGMGCGVVVSGFLDMAHYKRKDDE